MEVIEAIYHRRAVRSYTEAHVAQFTIEEIMDAAVQAPSSLNQQPWAFAVFQGKERLADYSRRAKEHFLLTQLPPLGLHERGDTLTDPNYNIFYNANTILVVLAPPRGHNSVEDCCLAAENVMLAAHGLGLGTCPIGIARAWLNLPEVKEELGLPPDYNAVFTVTLGYPAAQPPQTHRRAPAIVSWKKYQDPLHSSDNFDPHPLGLSAHCSMRLGASQRSDVFASNAGFVHCEPNPF
ncbi:MAG: nitroreductase [Opitutus sp.]